MRIVVETEREAYSTIAPYGPPAIQVRVKVDDEEELGLSHALTGDEMSSHFDLIWAYLGKQIKDAHAKRLKDKVQC